MPESAPTPDFSAFYRTTVSPLRRYLARMIGCADEARDLAQDAYVRVYAAMSERTIERPRAFLYVTARRLALDRLKRREFAAAPPEAAAEVISDGPDVRSLAIARQDWARLKEALDGLPAGCRSVLLLRNVEGLSHREIAGRLGISRSTVEKQLARALRLLRESYGDGEPPSPRLEHRRVGAANDV